MTYDEAMGKYGSDKPDLRFELPLVRPDRRGHAARRRRRRPAAVGGRAAGRHRQGAGGCRPPRPRRCRAPMLDKLEEFAKGFGARGLARARVGEGGEWTQSPLQDHHRRRCARRSTQRRAAAATATLLFFQFGAQASWSTPSLGACACTSADKLGLIPQGRSGSSCWVTDFPLFETTRTASWWPRTTRSPRRTPTDLERARERSRQGARARLRPRAQRQRDRRRLDPYPRSRRAGARVPGARHHRRGRAARSSASCSTRSSTARRRTAASRSASTAWRCCCAAPSRCAT